ncbi:unnamed protein product [Symbiodinium sp. CCMP2592]|nr:unnamed protein product [Symbiodinium sp. CCMP2592]
MAHPAQSSRQSWGRVLGLSSRGISITAQRFCDVTSLYFALDGSKLRPIQVPSPTFLLISLVVTSLLMAITMRSHWYGPRLFSHGQNGTGLQILDEAYHHCPESFRSCPGFRSPTSCAAQLHGFSRTLYTYPAGLCGQGCRRRRLPQVSEVWIMQSTGPQ